MSRPGNRTVEVELVEEDAGEPGLRSDADLGWRPPAARVPRRVWQALAGVAVVTVAGTAVGQHSQSAALDARLADVVGLSVPLGEPLTGGWAAAGMSVVGAVGDVVLVQAPDGRGLSAVDVADGDVRHAWRGACRLVAGDDDVGPAYPVPTHERGGEDLVMCVQRLGAGGLDLGQALPTVAHVHDPATGDLLRTIEIGHGVTWSPIGSDVVSLGFAADGHAVAGRWSLGSGEQRWAYRSAEPVPQNDSWGSSVDESVIRLEIGNWSLNLDATTGERIRAAPRRTHDHGAVWGPVQLDGGASAVSRTDAGGDAATTVRDAGGTTRFTVPGFLLPPTVDDASAPGMLFVVRAQDADGGQRLAGVDGVSGQVRWEATVPVGEIAVLSGLVVVHDPTGTTALDVRTGATRWTTTADPAWSGPGLVTDGRRVLTLEGDASGLALVARDVVSGATVWTSPSPVDDASLALLPDGTVLAVGSTEVVVLRP